MKRLLLISMILAVWLQSHPVSAAGPVVIFHQKYAVEIMKGGRAKVREDWRVGLGGAARQRAWRTFPLARIDSIADVSVADAEGTYTNAEGCAPRTYAIERSERDWTVTWCFIKHSNAPQDFTLQYTLEGVARPRALGQDELYLEFVQANRDYAIDSAEVEIRLPTASPFDETFLHLVKNGEVLHEWWALKGAQATFSEDLIKPDVSMGFRLRLPHYLIQAEEPEWRRHPIQGWLEQHHRALYAGLVVVGLLTLELLIRAWRMPRLAPPNWLNLAEKPKEAGYRTSSKVNEVARLPPAEAGLLLDRFWRSSHLAALIVDLGRRGVIRAVLDDNGDVMIQRAVGGEATGDDAALLTDLGSLESLRPLHQIPLLGTRLTQHAIASERLMNRDLTRSIAKPFAAVVLVALIVSGLLLWSGLIAAHFLFWLTPALAIVLVVLLLAHPLTLAGEMQRRVYRGLRRLLRNTTSCSGAAFEDLLPYAVAFRVTKRWVRACAAEGDLQSRWCTSRRGRPLERAELELLLWKLERAFDKSPAHRRISDFLVSRDYEQQGGMR